jgi:sigma-B regulation protein RsbU (phosphoserine phosphatase)
VPPSSGSRKQPLPADLLEALLPILAEVNANLDPDALLPTIARVLKRLIDYRILEIFQPAPDGSLVSSFVEGRDPGLRSRARIRPGEGIVGAAVRDRAPVFVPDVSQDPRYIAATPGVRAELAIPLIRQDKLVGVVNVEGPDPAAFTPEAQAALGVLASHLAVAVENATLHRETRWYAGLLATLYEIGKETASILELGPLLHRVAEIVKRVIDYEVFGILLWDESAGELVLRESVRFGKGHEKTRIKMGEGLVGACALQKVPIRVGDVRKDPRYLNLVPETRSELCIPMLTKDRLVGVFDLESTVLDRFTEEHVEVLTPLASQVAVAVENARLYAELRANEERLRSELQIAHDVQHGLFPEENPSGKGWEASAHFRPAQEVGGDLYDFYELRTGQLGLAVGDVAGKGVPAALYGAFASGTVRGRAFEGHSPSSLLQRVNRTLNRRGKAGLFCTLVYALFDFRAKTVRVSNSGLPYPLHYRKALGRCEAVELPGLPLGAFPETEYEERQLTLERGDVLVFFTDGITEALRGEEEYGIPRIEAQVEANPDLPATGLGEKILADVERFTLGASPADDFTLVVVKIR